MKGLKMSNEINMDVISCNVFNTLAKIDVRDKIEKKGQFNYLSWAWSWSEVQRAGFTPTRKIIKSDNGNIYHTDGKTAWVEVAVTINDIEHIEILPIMDFRNNSMPLDKITSMDINKAIQRCTVKALALHGLGLNIYAGEDLPIIPTLPHITDDAVKKAINWGIKEGKTGRDTLEAVLKKYDIPAEVQNTIVSMVDAKMEAE